MPTTLPSIPDGTLMVTFGISMHSFHNGRGCECLRLWLLLRLHLLLHPEQDAEAGFVTQLGQCPHERVHAIRRLHARHRIELAHLVLELRKRADVMHAALLVERSDRLGTNGLAA